MWRSGGRLGLGVFAIAAVLLGGCEWLDENLNGETEGSIVGGGEEPSGVHVDVERASVTMVGGDVERIGILSDGEVTLSAEESSPLLSASVQGHDLVLRAADHIPADRIVWVTVHAASGDEHATARVRVALNDGGFSGTPTTPTPTPTPGVAATIRVKTWVDDSVRNPTWIARQEGTGAWQTLSTSTAGRFTFTVASAATRYGVAIACDSGADVDVKLLFATPAEIDDVVFGCDGPNQATSTASGDVLGATAEDAHVHLVDAKDDVAFSAVAMPYSVSGPQGRRDVVAYTTLTVDNSPSKGAWARDVDLTSDATVDLNLATPDFVPSAQTVTVTASSGSLLTHGAFWTDDGTRIAFDGTGTLSFIGVAGTLGQVPGDIHHTVAEEDRIATNGTTPIRRAEERFFEMPQNVVVVLGTQYTSPTVNSVSSTPYARLRASLGTTFGLPAYRASFSDASREWEMTATLGWLGAGTTFEMPNFSGVGSFDTSWGYPTGSPVSWAVEALTATVTPILPPQIVEAVHNPLNRPTEAVPDTRLTRTGTRGSITP